MAGLLIKTFCNVISKNWIAIIIFFLFTLWTYFQGSLLNIMVLLQVCASSVLLIWLGTKDSRRKMLSSSRLLDLLFVSLVLVIAYAIVWGTRSIITNVVFSTGMAEYIADVFSLNSSYGGVFITFLIDVVSKCLVLTAFSELIYVVSIKSYAEIKRIPTTIHYYWLCFTVFSLINIAVFAVLVLSVYEGGAMSTRLVMSVYDCFCILIPFSIGKNIFENVHGGLSDLDNLQWDKSI